MASSVPVRALIVAGAASFAVSPRSLAAAFTRVADPRRAASVRYPCAGVLSLVVVAILANHLSVLAIAEWGARQSGERLRLLGFAEGRSPCHSTLQRLFCKVDGQATPARRYPEALIAHFGPVAVPLPVAAGSQGVGIDGKAQRGRLPFQRGGCPVHATPAGGYPAFRHEYKVVLAQEPIEQGADASEGELTVAPALIARIAWPGRVLTGDALFCQRHLCQQVLAAGGAYLLIVKDNQPTLHEAIAVLFDPPPALGPAALTGRREGTTRGHGHGRQQDVRTLAASTDLNDSLDWPGLGYPFTWVNHIGWGGILPCAHIQWSRSRLVKIPRLTRTSHHTINHYM